MKIIISHDVDHITSCEHFKDLFLIKYLTRNILELYKKSISFRQFYRRLLLIFKNKFNNIQDLLTFDAANSVFPTYFIAVNNALSLSYNKKYAKKIASTLVKKGICIGLHGINFETLQGIIDERDLFQKLTGVNPKGVRMHYLRENEETHKYLEQAGYVFDSTQSTYINPFKVGTLWEFPVHLMDSTLIYGNSRIQIKPLKQIQYETIQAIENAEILNIEYFTLVTHDFYFSDSHKLWKDWYIWLINYLKDRSYVFISFENAILECEK